MLIATLLIVANKWKGFPCGSAGKESACRMGDLGSIPGLRRSPGEGKGYPLQYSGLENSMDCTVYGVSKSQTLLKKFHFTSTSGSHQMPINWWMSRWNVIEHAMLNRGVMGRGSRGFPGGPVLKMPPSSAWDRAFIPGRRTKIAHALWPKHQNISNIVINSLQLTILFRKRNIIRIYIWMNQKTLC